MDRVLLVKTSSLGDVIHNLPVVSDIRHHFPDVSIDWLVEEAITFIPQMHPGVNEVIPVALRRWRKNLFSAKTWREIGAVRNALRTTKYDAVIDTQGLLKSALLARWANGPVYGQDRISARESLASRLYDKSFNISRKKHAVERNRELAALALGYPAPASPADYGASIGSPDRPGFMPESDYIYVLHGTARASKRWPKESWTKLFRELAASKLRIVAAWGSPDEKRLSDYFAENESAVIVPRGRLDVMQSAQVIANSKAVIGVDTGFSHLAAALGIPVVGIYTDTDPALSGVYGSGKARAINVGNVGVIPSVAQVLAAFSSLS